MSYGLSLSEEELLRRMMISSKDEQRAARKRDGGAPPAPDNISNRIATSEQVTTRQRVMDNLTRPMVTTELMGFVTVTRPQLKTVLRRMVSEGILKQSYLQVGSTKMALWEKV